MSKILPIIVSILLLGLSACSTKSNYKPRNDVMPEVDYVSSDNLDYRVVDEEDAVRLAQRHLALKKRSWGKVVDVAEEDSRYYVMFETPKREMRLLGQRKLIVEKQNGLVKTHKRR